MFYFFQLDTITAYFNLVVYAAKALDLAVWIDLTQIACAIHFIASSARVGVVYKAFVCKFGPV